MTGNRHISEEELALHAMQALDGEESAAVRLHVSECAACRAQLAEISGDLALVGMSVEQHAIPDGARERFVDRITAGPARPTTTSTSTTATPASCSPWACPWPITSASSP